MKLTPLELEGAFIVDIEPREDERGFFARSFCHREFEAAGLKSTFTQCNVSRNKQRGILRGMHYQVAPHEEAKLVRCTMGAIFDVMIDLRRESKTFCRWLGFDLTAENHRALYIPEGFAHGFLTLSEESEVLYQMSTDFSADHARGVRWDDPAFAIDWPLARTGRGSPLGSIRDLKYTNFSESYLREGRRCAGS